MVHWNEGVSSKFLVTRPARLSPPSPRQSPKQRQIKESGSRPGECRCGSPGRAPGGSGVQLRHGAAAARLRQPTLPAARILPVHGCTSKPALSSAGSKAGALAASLAAFHGGRILPALSSAVAARAPPELTGKHRASHCSDSQCWGGSGGSGRRRAGGRRSPSPSPPSSRVTAGAARAGAGSS